MLYEMTDLQIRSAKAQRRINASNAPRHLYVIFFTAEEFFVQALKVFSEQCIDVAVLRESITDFKSLFKLFESSAVHLNFSDLYWLWVFVTVLCLFPKFSKETRFSSSAHAKISAVAAAVY